MNQSSALRQKFDASRVAIIAIGDWIEVKGAPARDPYAWLPRARLYRVPIERENVSLVAGVQHPDFDAQVVIDTVLKMLPFARVEVAGRILRNCGDGMTEEVPYHVEYRVELRPGQTVKERIPRITISSGLDIFSTTRAIAEAVWPVLEAEIVAIWGKTRVKQVFQSLDGHKLIDPEDPRARTQFIAKSFGDFCIRIVGGAKVEPKTFGERLFLRAFDGDLAREIDPLRNAAVFDEAA